MASIFYNRYPETLEEELLAARAVNASPIVVPSDSFLDLAARGERLIYAVVERLLVVSESTVRLQRITHPVLADGRPVSAAGEVELIAESDFMVVMALNNRSGHYVPDSRSLEVAKTAFEACGFIVPTDSVDPYTQESA